MLKHTRVTILLSLNMVAVLIAGVKIADAIASGSGGSLGSKIVAEHSDEVEGEVGSAELADAQSEDKNQGPAGEADSGSPPGQPDGSSLPYPGSPAGAANLNSGALKSGELWAAESMTIYLSADKDICVDAEGIAASDMYWQTSNAGAISAFYQSSRDYLGFSGAKCRFPQVAGLGETIVTAGTYDGRYRDSIRVTVLSIPVADWQGEVLRLVNAERAKVGVAPLGFGDTCAAAAATRAREIAVKYDHTRPDGSGWATACPIPAAGGASGENIHAGNSAVSPAAAVREWMASPTHRANILDARFSRLAVGLYFDIDSQYRIHWSQFFSSY